MLLSLAILSFTKNLRINAKLERAYSEKVKEGYNLRGACLIALQKLPLRSETPGEEKGQEGAGYHPQEKSGSQGTGIEAMEPPLPEEGVTPLGESQETREGNQEMLTGKEEYEKDHWKPRPQPYILELGGKEYSIFMEDEGGKLNINALVEKEKDIFQRLLEVRGMNQQEAQVLTDCLLDWLDRDATPQPRGAESDYYESLPEPYPCRNGPLESLEELTLVKGTSPEVYEKIGRDLTIYGKELKININTASKEVVHAILGISLQQADEVVAFVKEKKGLKNLDELKDLFLKFGVAGKDFEEARTRMTTTGSPYLSIRSTGPIGWQYRLVVDKSRESIVAVYPE